MSVVVSKRNGSLVFLVTGIPRGTMIAFTKNRGMRAPRNVRGLWPFLLSPFVELIFLVILALQVSKEEIIRRSENRDSLEYGESECIGLSFAYDPAKSLLIFANVVTRFADLKILLPHRYASKLKKFLRVSRERGTNEPLFSTLFEARFNEPNLTRSLSQRLL